MDGRGVRVSRWLMQRSQLLNQDLLSVEAAAGAIDIPPPGGRDYRGVNDIIKQLLASSSLIRCYV